MDGITELQPRYSRADFPIHGIISDLDGVAYRDRHIRQALILTRRGPIELCRALHVECLVGTFVVVAIDELIELGLLLEEVAGRRLLEARLEKAG
jgi:hypothetical protein